LSSRIEGLSTEDAYREAYVYVSEAGLRLFYEPHGLCGARSASEMACHEEAGTVQQVRWSRHLGPNYTTRTPGLCAGCASFAVAQWHRPFWERRYIDHVAELRQLEALGMVGPEWDNANRLTMARAQQAAALCRKLGADMAEVERRIAVRRKEMLNAAD
jgi:hypothetical protein